MPLAASDLAIKAETVEFTFIPHQHAWSVAAHYDLINTVERPVSTQLAVPEYRCVDEPEFDEGCDPARGGFAQLEAVVRERAQRLRKTRLPVSGEAAPAAPEYAWMLPLRLLASESIAVDQQYLVPAGESSDGGFSGTYLVRGSSFWAKPIGRATFKFTFSARSCLIVEPEHVARKSRRVVMHGDEPWLEAVYETYVWTAPSDVTLYFEPCVAPRDTEIAGCSAAADLARFFYPAESDEEVEPISEEALRTLLGKLPDDELERCRDGVFTAYAGYFSESELKRLPPHPELKRHYTAALLTAADWAWVQFLDQRVAERTTARAAREAANRKAAKAAKGCGCQSLAYSAHTPTLWLWLPLLGWLQMRRRRC